MSFFAKALASFGVGAAKVDTRLEKSTYRQGEMIRGEIHVQGGQTGQMIDEIYLYLVIQYDFNGSQQEYVVNEFRISDAFEIGPRESQVIPFEFQLPYDCPVSTGASPIYLKTGLDIKMALDPSDTDGIEVLPYPLIDEILHGIENIGFRLTSIEFNFENFYSRHPFVQEYLLVPTNSVYQTTYDEIKMVFYPHTDEVDVIMSIDLKAIDLMSSMEEAMDLDKRLVRFTITKQDVNRRILIDKLKYHIDKHVD